MQPPRALAIGAHPDDVEFMMGGTLLLLRQAGWETHSLNIASGSLGGQNDPPRRLAAIRLREVREAARRLGAVHHPPLVGDLEIYY